MSATWSLYVLRCNDDSLYTGITTDVPRRVREHQSGRTGAKYLRGRGPFVLELALPIGDRGAASRAEHRVKRLPKPDKERLLTDPAAMRACILDAASVADCGRSQSCQDSHSRRVASSDGK